MYPIANVIIAAGFKFEDVENIQEKVENAERIQDSFREKWKCKCITDQHICDDLIDYDKLPNWIKNAIKDERLRIQHLIKNEQRNKLSRVA